MSDLSRNTKAYGDALFMLAEELSETEKILSEVGILEQLIKENPQYPSLLDSPALSNTERLGLINDAFGSFSRPLLNTVRLLCEKRLCRSLAGVLSSFRRAYELSYGIERVEVISAVPLTSVQTARLREKLEKITQKQIIISNTHDPSILAGMKIRYMGVQLDSSLKTKLERFEKSLGELVI